MMAVMESAVSAAPPAILGRVFNLQRCSVHDGPGIRTTVFLKGCPLRCAWCHNPEGIDSETGMMISDDLCLNCDGCRAVCPIQSRGAAPAGVPWDRNACTSCGSCVEACPSGARELAGADFEVPELADILQRDRPFFEASGGGVTFSGGEPMAQPGFLAAALQECRVRGLHTAVDTCGFAPRNTVVEIAELTDLVLFDLKHMDAAVHREYTGVDNRLILENLGQLSRSEIEVWIRIPLIPGFNDDNENIRATAAFIAGLPRRHRVFVLPYHAIAEGKTDRLGATGSFARYNRPSTTALEAVVRRLQSHGLDVTAGGSP